MEKFKLSEYNSDRDFSNVELTPKQAILAQCLQCVCWQRKEMVLCPSKNCPLWRISRKYLSKTSRTKKEYSESELIELRERLSKAREKRLSNEV